MYLLVAGTKVLAGGTTYHAIFETTGLVREEETKVVSASLTSTPPFCQRSLRSWLFGTQQYFLGSRGTCSEGNFDFLELFVAEGTPAGNNGATEDVLPRASDMRIIMRSTFDTFAASEMFSQNGEPPTLCFMPTGTSAPKVPTLYCHQQNKDVKTVSLELPEFLAVRTIRYSVNLDAIIVGGIGSKGCQLTLVRYNAKSQAITLVARPPFSLANVTGCLAVDCINEASTVLVIGASTLEGIVLYAVSTETWNYNTAAVVLPLSTCSAIATDAATLTGIAAFRRDISSTLVKYRLNASLAATDVVMVFGMRQISSTLIPQLAAQANTRMIYGVARDSTGVVVLRFSVIDVESVYPKFADRRGGTEITVYGSGFYNSTSAKCRFGDRSTSNITYKDAHTVLCDAPLIEGATCEEQPVEVAINGWAFSKNDVGIARVDPPFLIAASPPRIARGRAIASGRILVEGQGFVPTDTMTCRFSDNISSIVVPGTFVTANTIYCEPPPLNSPLLLPSGDLRVALDGSQYTTLGVPFVIAGAPMGIKVVPSIVENASAPVTSFSAPVVVYTIDEKGNELRYLDPVPLREGGVWFQRSNATANVTLEFVLRQGIGNIAMPQFNYPTRTTITMNVIVSATLRSNFQVIITQGDLSWINITQQPNTTIFSGVSMKRNPRLQLLDVSNNSWWPPIDQPVLMTCEVEASDGIVHQTFPVETVGPEGGVEFFNLQIDTQFGAQYTFIFSLRQFPEIPRVRSLRIQSNCAEDEFLTDVTCRRCLEGGVCNGSSIMLLQQGYWRDNASVPVVYPCRRVEDCLGGSPTGGCAPGYEGPLCTMCVEGFGRNQDDRCTECASRGVVILTLVATVTVMLLAIVGYAILCIQYCETDNNLLVISSIVINFGQTVTTMNFLDLDWPDVALRFYNYVGMVVDFALHSLASHCEIQAQGKTYVDITGFYYSSLLFAPALALLVRLILRLFPRIFMTKSLIDNVSKAIHQRRDMSKEARRAHRRMERRRKKEAEKQLKENHKFLPVMCATIQVYLFLSYQTVANHALNIFNCEDIVRGSITENLLSVDFNVNCDSSKYDTAYGFAVFMSVVYGIVLPVFSTVWTVSIISRFRTEDDIHMRRVFLPFQMLGLKDTAWYWQPLIMAKKFASLTVAIWNPYPLDAYLTMWVQSIYTAMVWYIRPYRNDAHNFLEMFASYTIVATINAGLLWHVTPWEVLRWVELGAMFVMYAVLAVLFLYHGASTVKRWGMTIYHSIKEQRLVLAAEDDESEAGSDIDISDEDDDVFPTSVVIDGGSPSVKFKVPRSEAPEGGDLEEDQETASTEDSWEQREQPLLVIHLPTKDPHQQSPSPRRARRNPLGME